MLCQTGTVLGAGQGWHRETASIQDSATCWSIISRLCVSTTCHIPIYHLSSVRPPVYHLSVIHLSIICPSSCLTSVFGEGCPLEHLEVPMASSGLGLLNVGHTSVAGCRALVPGPSM